MKIIRELLFIANFVTCVCYQERKFLQEPTFSDKICSDEEIEFEARDRSEISCAIQCTVEKGCNSFVYHEDKGICYGIKPAISCNVFVDLPGARFYRSECEKFNVLHGVVHGNMTTVGATVEVVPDTGYTLGSQSSTSVCQYNGTWDNIPVPELVECEKFNVLHGVVHGNMTTVGSILEVVPDTGYTLGSQSSTSVCQYNGTWDNIPVPELVDCGQPHTVPNSIITGGNTVYGSSRTFYCANGYYLAGASTDMTVKCKADGTWSELSFQCEVNPCDDGWSYFKPSNDGKCYKGIMSKTNGDTAEDYCSRVIEVSGKTWKSVSGFVCLFCEQLYDNIGANGYDNNCFTVKRLSIYSACVCCKQSVEAICRNWW